MMRSFNLINSKGHRYNLNDLDFFLYDVSELGFKKNAKIIKAGNVFKAYNKSVDQPKPKGTIRFKEPDSYKKYYEFTRFATSEPLILEYIPGETQTAYRLDCYISSIEKREIEGNGLHCEIQFGALSFWYKVYSMEAGTDTRDGKIYDYTYPFRYSDRAAGTVALDVDSNMESPTIISIHGPCVNPTWNHYVNNVLVSSGICYVDIPADRILVIDSAHTPFQITEQDEYGNVIFDRYELSDLSTERFIFLQNGRNRISVAHDGAMVPRLKVEARVLYETV